MISAKITFNPGASPESFLIHCIGNGSPWIWPNPENPIFTGQTWRFLTDDVAVELVPLCDAEARLVKASPPFDWLEISPVSALPEGSSLIAFAGFNSFIRRDALPLIIFRADFHQGEKCETIWLAGCHKRLLTVEEKNLLPRQVEAVFTHGEVCDKLDCKSATLKQYCLKLGLPDDRFTAADFAQISDYRAARKRRFHLKVANRTRHGLTPKKKAGI